MRSLPAHLGKLASAAVRPPAVDEPASDSDVTVHHDAPPLTSYTHCQTS